MRAVEVPAKDVREGDLLVNFDGKIFYPITQDAYISTHPEHDLYVYYIEILEGAIPHTYVVDVDATVRVIPKLYNNS